MSDGYKLILNSILSKIMFGAIVITSFFPGVIHAATLSELEKQQAQVQAKADALKQQATIKQTKISNINDLLESLKQQINSYQTQVTSTQKDNSQTANDISLTQSQIEAVQVKLEDNQAKLVKSIQTIYVLGRQSSIEILLSNDSLSSAMARQEYLTALSNKIKSMGQDIQNTKKEIKDKQDTLQQKQQNLIAKKEQLLSYQSTIAAQKNQQSVLLDGAQSERNQILAAAKDAQSEANQVSTQIYALRAQMSSKSHETVSSSNSSGYPYANLVPDSIGDPWGFLVRECTSYAAWYFNSVEGRSWNRIAGYGDGWGWKHAASGNSYNTHSTPQVGAIITWSKSKIAPYGHVAIVMKVNDDGTIDVSEYNWNTPYGYGYRSEVRPGDYGSYTYIY